LWGINGSNLIHATESVSRKVGIGFTDDKLHVKTGNGIDVRVRSEHTGNGYAGFVGKNSQAEYYMGAQGSFDTSPVTAGGNVGIDPTVKFQVNGQAAKLGGGSWQATSDHRTKREVKRFATGLETILDIRRSKYNKEFGIAHDPHREFVGVIAQELREVALFMVDTFEHKANNQEEEHEKLKDVPSSDIEDGDELLSVDPSARKYRLINAVQGSKSSSLKCNQISIGSKSSSPKCNRICSKLSFLNAWLVAVSV